MSDWLKRYQAGKHREVWAKMQALGPAIREPAHLKPAQEVIQETMKLARQNVLWLFEGLPALGYRFAGPPEPAEPDYPLELRLHNALEYMKKHGEAKYRDNPWAHPALAWVDDEEIELPAHHRNGRPARANFRPPGARTTAALDAAETSAGRPLPLAVRGWLETVGSVDLAGTHPMLNRGGTVAALRITLERAAELPVSDAGAEFVESLRHAFVWAGFPGWSVLPDPPERELAWLRAKLAPF